jgi:hypothetical protein
LLLAQGHAVGGKPLVWRPTLNIRQDDLAHAGPPAPDRQPDAANLQGRRVIHQQRGELQIVNAAALRERAR